MIEDKFGAELLGPQLPARPWAAFHPSRPQKPTCPPCLYLFLHPPLPTFSTEAGEALGLGLAG